MIKIIQKILILFLIIPCLFVVSCKDDDKDEIENQEPEINDGSGEGDNNSGNEEVPFTPSIIIDEQTLQPRYYYLNFDLTSIKIIDNYELNKTNTISLDESMISPSDYEKLTTIGSHKITVTYNGKMCEVIINLVDKVHVTFTANGKIIYSQNILCGSDVHDVPEVPERDGYIGKWNTTNFSAITSDLHVEAIYINNKANTVEEVVAYLDSILTGIEVTNNLVLDEYIGNCTIDWSADSEYLTEEGIYKRPYDETVVNLYAHITDGTTHVDTTYTYTLEGYRSLDGNLASGYVFRSYGTLNDEFYETMDIIYCAFIEVDVNGDVVGKDATGDSIKLRNDAVKDKIKTFIIPKARKEGSYVVASLGGGGNAVTKTYRIVAASDELRKKYAQKVVEVINECGLDGVDLDWETPRSSEAKNFTLLMKEIYTAVKANNPNHIVTAAIGGGSQCSLYDLRNSGQYLDFINVMSYSMASSSGYYQSNLYSRSGYHNPTARVGRSVSSIHESVANFNAYGVPNSKLIIGAAFYGKVQMYTGSYWTSSGSVDYSVIKTKLQSGVYDYYYDEVAKVPYLLSKDGKEFVSYDDEKSIIDKCTYIKENKLAGLMFWESGCDITGDLVHAMNIGLKQ